MKRVSRVLALFLSVVLLVGSVPWLAEAEVVRNPVSQAVIPYAFCDEMNVTEIPCAECEALVALYSSSNGPGWTNKSGWLQTNTPCSWYGVTCNSGHVSALSLDDNRLSGSIPPQVGNLASLESLYWPFNQLSGSIPPQLGNLTNLWGLYLSYNQLGGEVPPALTNLRNLSWADLAYNKLTATDPAVIAFLNAKDPDWAETQTVPPPDARGVAAPLGLAVQLSWTPILYTGDGGCYEVSYATTHGGPYKIHGTTADKRDTGYLADNLPPAAIHFFIVRTRTPAHGEQQNALWSDYSREVAVVSAAARRVALPWLSVGAR